MLAAINDQSVIASTTLHEQIGRLCELLRPDGIGLLYEKIGTLFTPHKSHSTIKRHLDSYNKIPKAPQRPDLLSEEQYRTLDNNINSTIADSGPPLFVEYYHIH